MSALPICPHEAPHGYEFVAEEEDGDWRVDNSGRRCRMLVARRACGKPCVLRFNRWMNKRGGRRVPSWWHYCAEHTYGRWIENGVVMHWVLQPIGVVPADNKRGWVVVGHTGEDTK